MTWVYFVSLDDSPTGIQQTAYSIGKTIQFGFPVAWVLLFDRTFFRSRHRKETLQTRFGLSHDMWLGVAFGLIVVALIYGIYFAFLQSTDVGTMLVEKVREKTVDVGFQSRIKFIGLGIFYALVHSFLEEYYWRWFVFGYLRKNWSAGPAIIISSLAFMAHHVILLAVFFGWTSPLTYLFSIAVGTGGAFWAWLYYRTDDLKAPWMSHLIVDAGIFSLGYLLIRQYFSG